MFKRNNLYLYITVLLIGMLLFSSLVVFASTDNVKDSRLSTSAYSAALYVPETQSFLYLKNADKKLPMASTTKIMTALITLEQCKLTDEVIICKDAVGVEGSSAYLKEGESFTVEQLLYALLLQSANDAAVALAYQVSGSVEDFAYLMTERAESIGATNTRFSNPHGLDCEDHYTTARDLALIAAEAMKNEEFVKISSTVKKSFGRDEICRTFINHNKLLRRYDGCIGVKTGFTKKSGRCLVSAAEREGLRLISVTLDAPNDWNDHTSMLDFGFCAIEKIVLADEGEIVYRIPVIGGSKDTLTVVNPEAVSVILPKKDYNISSRTQLYRYVIAPIQKGEIIGEVIYYADGKECARVALAAAEDIYRQKDKSIIDRILSIFK